MVKVKEDLTGKVFGRLKVLEQVEDYVYPDGKHRLAQWLCECACEEHNKIIVVGRSLTSGNTQSCGCLKKEVAKSQGIGNAKANVYIIKDNIVIGKSSNTDDEFYCDVEDFGKIQKICWCVTCVNGFKRISGRDPETGKTMRMHVYLGFKNFDHIDRNELNNRKNNLRQATQMQNCQNSSLRSNNKSGITGVYFHKRDSVWISQITVNKQKIILGKFIDKGDAIRARLNAEAKYFGEFAPQQHLYEKYNINNKTK